jgi:hypothetical protein
MSLSVDCRLAFRNLKTPYLLDFFVQWNAGVRVADRVRNSSIVSRSIVRPTQFECAIWAIWHGQTGSDWLTNSIQPMQWSKFYGNTLPLIGTTAISTVCFCLGSWMYCQASVPPRPIILPGPTVSVLAPDTRNRSFRKKRPAGPPDGVR